MELGTLILQIGVVIAVSRLAAIAFAKFQQPKVMGEMFAGIMLGPSLLGRIAPDAMVATVKAACTAVIGAAVGHPMSLRRS